MASFKFQYTRCNLEFIPNDVEIQITAYLTDADGNLFVSTSSLDIDTFTVKTNKLSLPTSGYASFLSIIAGKYIAEKYNSPNVGGYGVNGSAIVTRITDTTALVPGLFVYGSNIPTDTTILNIRDKNSIELSNPLTYTGDLILNFSTHGWEIDYSQITHLTNVIDFSAI